jgi:hypothetical protein
MIWCFLSYLSHALLIYLLPSLGNLDSLTNSLSSRPTLLSHSSLIPTCLATLLELLRSPPPINSHLSSMSRIVLVFFAYFSSSSISSRISLSNSRKSESSPRLRFCLLLKSLLIFLPTLNSSSSFSSTSSPALPSSRVPATTCKVRTIITNNFCNKSFLFLGLYFAL